MPDQSIDANGTTDVNGAITFKLDNFPGYAAYTAAFDSYRITAARVLFIAGTQLGVSNPASNPPLHTVIDYDDASVLTVSDLVQYDTWTAVPAGVTHSRALRPRASMAVYNTPLTTGYALAPPTAWMDAASPDIPYYGVKYSLPVTTTANQVRWQTFVTLEVQFRNPR